MSALGDYNYVKIKTFGGEAHPLEELRAGCPREHRLFLL
jgi:hypothetical protein